MTKLRTLFAEALRSIGANVSTTFASALSVLIGMFLIGVFIGLGTWLVSWSDDKKRELAVHVFIADAATTKQVDALRVKLESDKRVKPGGITFCSKSCALKIMQKRNPELTANLASNPLPASFVQESLWFLHLLEPESPVYNSAMAWRLSGRLSTRLTSTTPPTADEVVSTSGDSAVTVTASVIFAMCRSKSAVSVSETLTWTVRVCGWKPDISSVSE